MKRTFIRGVPIALLLTVTLVSAEVHARTNLFPQQSISVLMKGGVESGDSPPELPIDKPPMEAPKSEPPKAETPFKIIGLWREEGHQVVLLDGLGKLFPVSGESGSQKGVIHLGGELAAGYRLKSVSKGAVVLKDAAGKDHTLQVDSPASQ